MSAVRLVDVDEPMLARLVEVAVADAAADEVTPPLTPGPAWTPERVAWFVDYHRRCRDGLTGAAGEQTWAVVEGEQPVGSVRLQRSSQADAAVTGIWLARSARGRGLSSAATDALLRLAPTFGIRVIEAETSEHNAPALALLAARGFTLADPADGRVGATLNLDAWSRRAAAPTVGR